MLQKEALEKICNLAKIRIDESCSEQFFEKLNSVLEWIDKLSEIDVSGVDIDDENDIESLEGTPMRGDIASMDNTRDELLSNSQHKKFDMFSVPKVIE
jgi:aspartyl-tRNA(Asn)/glutamyl-tRNA(Gln) amidotransferase subunit C